MRATWLPIPSLFIRRNKYNNVYIAFHKFSSLLAQQESTNSVRKSKGLNNIEDRVCSSS
jgi:hypothetical protein